MANAPRKSPAPPPVQYIDPAPNQGPIWSALGPLNFPEYPNTPQAPKNLYNGPSGIGRTKSGSRRQDLQATAVAEGSPVRVIYGRDQIGADVVDLFVASTGVLVIVAVWGEGPCAGVEKLFLGDTEFTGTARTYTNNRLSDDAFLLAEQSTYAGRPDGFFFTVLEIPTSYKLTSLDVWAIVNGRNDFAGNEDTPARCLGHFASEFLGVTVNATDLATCATFNEELLAALTGNPIQDRGKYRQKIGLTFDRFTTKERAFATLRDLAQVYTAFDGSELRMTPNRDDATVGAITPSQIIKNTAKKTIPGLARSPNVVTVVYTAAADDSQQWEDGSYSTEEDFPPSGSARRQLVRIPAIQSRAMAKRVAIQRLNYYQTIRLEGSFETRDESIKYLAGALVDFTDTEGANAKEVRILDCPATGKGRWRIKWQEHDPAAYANDYVAEPTVEDSNLPSPNVFPAVVNPDSIVERLWTDKAGQTHTVFDVYWTGSAWVWADGYRIRMRSGATVVFDHIFAHLGDGETHHFVSPPTEVGILYTVEIWIINVLGKQAPTAGSGTQTGAGNTIPPTDPVGMTGREAAQFVSLRWSPSVDTNLRGYQVRRLNKTDYDAAGSGAARWGHANAETVVNRIDSTTVVLTNQSVGAFYYMVKAEDFDGNFSNNSSDVLVNITGDQAGAVIETELDGLTLVNMYSWDSRPQEGNAGGVCATTSPSETWVDMFGAAGSLWTDNFSAGDFWCANLNVASSVESEEWDTTKDNSGNWIFSAAHTVYSGTVTYTSRLAKAADYPTFTDINGQSINGEGRYYKAKIGVAAAVGAGFSIKYPFTASFEGIRIINEGEESVPAVGQPVIVTFTNPHSVVPLVTCQLTGSTPGFALPDNITTDDFELSVWDVDGVAMAGVVKWQSEGP